MISDFVEMGSRFENNVQPNTKEELLRCKDQNRIPRRHFFEAVKLELVNDVLTNPTLRRILNLESDSRLYGNSTTSDVIVIS
jgi:hypothetical protein